MRYIRATAAAVLLLNLAAASAQGQCVSSVRILSERGSRARFLAGPGAWNGAIFAVAVTELDRASFEIFLYDEYGNQLAANEKIRTSGSDLLDVLWNGTEFAVFYKTESGVLGLTRVGTNGKVIGPRVLGITSVPLAGDETAAVVWSSQHNQYLVAHTVKNGALRRIRATWLRADGAVARQSTINDAAGDSFVRVALTATDTAGIFYEDEKNHNVIYSAIRDDVNRKPLIVWDSGGDVQVAVRGDLFVLLRRAVLGARTVVRWETIDTSGGLVRRDSRLLMGTGSDVDPVALLASRGTEYALSYLEWPNGIGLGDPVYRLIRFGLDEEHISDTYFSAASTRRRREHTKFDFEWTGSAYISLASLEDGDDEDTFLLRMCPLRASISAPRVAHPGQAVTFVGSAEGGVPEYKYQWTWGDGLVAQDAELQVTFDALGEHGITLRVTDAAGTMTTETFLLTTVPVPVPVPVPEIRRRAVRK